MKYDVLSPLLFNFAVEYDLRKVRENEKGLELDETHQILVYADDIIILDGNINTIKKIKKVLLYPSTEAGLEVNTEKTKYKFISPQRSSGQNHNLIVANKSFENVAKFKYMRTKVTIPYCIHEEIRNR
jgi:alpha-N-acetylglucosamine transferase